jgi:hypothetical protein
MELFHSRSHGLLLTGKCCQDSDVLLGLGIPRSGPPFISKELRHDGGRVVTAEDIRGILLFYYSTILLFYYSTVVGTRDIISAVQQALEGRRLGSCERDAFAKSRDSF